MAEHKSKLDALLKILNLLDLQKNLTPFSIATTLGVGERTVYRYLRSLQSAGYPIYFDNIQQSYRFAEGYQLKRSSFETLFADLLELKRCVLNACSVGISVYDHRGICILANDAMGTIWHVSKEELLGQDYHFLEPWKQSGLFESVKMVMHNGKEFHKEFYVQDSSKGDFWITCCITPFDYQGKRYLLLVTYDITTLKQTEIRLKYNESLITDFLEELPAGIMKLDHKGRVEYLNSSFTSRYGWTLEDIKTLRHWLTIAYPDPLYRARVLKRWKGLFRNALETGMMTVLLEVSITCKDNTMRHTTISARRSDHFTYVLFYDTADVSEQKHGTPATNDKGNN